MKRKNKHINNDIMNTLWTIISMLFVGLVSYIIGIRRGWKTYETPCPKEETVLYYKAGYEAGMREAKRQAKREEKSRAFIASLEDALGPEDEENVIDCGEY